MIRFSGGEGRARLLGADLLITDYFFKPFSTFFLKYEVVLIAPGTVDDCFVGIMEGICKLKFPHSLTY